MFTLKLSFISSTHHSINKKKLFSLLLNGAVVSISTLGAAPKNRTGQISIIRNQFTFLQIALKTSTSVGPVELQSL